MLARLDASDAKPSTNLLHAGHSAGRVCDLFVVTPVQYGFLLNR